MASKKTLKGKGTASKSKRAPVKRAKAPGKVKSVAPSRKTSRASSAAKATATRGAQKKADETAKFSRTASRVYGKNSQTAKRLKELNATARRWALEAKQAKTITAKKNARAKAGKARDAAANVFRAATSQGTRGQAKQRGWKEVTTPDRSRLEQADTFTSFEHARHGAGSLLSLLESRPGTVGIIGWRRVSQIENARPGGLTRAGALRPELAARAKQVARDLRLSGDELRDFNLMLIDAELYGVEVELEVEAYPDV